MIFILDLHRSFSYNKYNLKLKRKRTSCKGDKFETNK